MKPWGSYHSYWVKTLGSPHTLVRNPLEVSPTGSLVPQGLSGNVVGSKDLSLGRYEEGLALFKSFQGILTISGSPAF